MNTIKIYLKPSGSVAELYKDFALFVNAYQNKLVDVYVPKTVLYSNENNTFANAVKIGGVLTASDGSQVSTDGYYLDYLKDETVGNIEYSVYERILPKELTVYAGNQQVVVNVVSVDNTDSENPTILQVITTQICNLLVQNSAYLADQETMTPSQYEEVNSKITENQTNIVDLQSRMTTAETNISSNTEDIAQNKNDIASLKQIIGTGGSGFTITFINIGNAVFSGMMILCLVMSIVFLVGAFVLGKWLFPMLSKNITQNNQDMVNLTVLKGKKE